jgi:hypothetical protein
MAPVEESTVLERVFRVRVSAREMDEEVVSRL